MEDHASFRQALAHVLERETEFVVAAQAGSLVEARASLKGIDLAVVDLGLPDGDGAELIRELVSYNSKAMTIVLSASLDPIELARAVENGASGVLHKSASIQEIVSAIGRLRAGETLLSSSETVQMLRVVTQKRHQEREAQAAIEKLTRREREVLRALAEGLSSKEIAQRLYITVETERTHMVNILTKLGVHSRLQALIFAARHGVIEIH